MAYNREIWSWAFYDFGNSAFFTSVTSVIFNVYFVQVVVGTAGLSFLGSHYSGSTVWGMAVSLSMVLIFITAPVLGAIADFRACKKQFLFFFCYVGVASTLGLFWATPGAVWWALFFFMAANLCIHGSQPFYNAFLSEITTTDRMGRISGFGWAVGYAGGLLCLVLNLLMIEYPGWFGIPERDYLPVRLSLVVVALWWGVFAIPLVVGVRERAVAQEMPAGVGPVRLGFSQLYQTFREIRRYRELAKFLIAFLLYNDGIQTVIVMAAVFGAETLQMSSQELILCFIMIQLVAFAGALIFGSLADRLAGKRTIMITLVVWSVAVVYALVIQTSWQFWVLGVVIGLVLGGSQSASRSLFAQFTPPRKSAEFFGFYSTSEKASSIFGPALFGLAVHLTGSTQYAIGSVLIFLVAGMLMLIWVDEKKGLETGRLES